MEAPSVTDSVGNAAASRATPAVEGSGGGLGFDDDADSHGHARAHDHES